MPADTPAAPRLNIRSAPWWRPFDGFELREKKRGRWEVLARGWSLPRLEAIALARMDEVRACREKEGGQ